MGPLHFSSASPWLRENQGRETEETAQSLPGCYHLAHFLTGLAPITNQLARVVLLYLNRTQIKFQGLLFGNLISLCLVTAMATVMAGSSSR